jgi:hypothetical protein
MNLPLVFICIKIYLVSTAFVTLMVSAFAFVVIAVVVVVDYYVLDNHVVH